MALSDNGFSAADVNTGWGRWGEEDEDIEVGPTKLVKRQLNNHVS